MILVPKIFPIFFLGGDEAGGGAVRAPLPQSPTPIGVPQQGRIRGAHLPHIGN